MIQVCSQCGTRWNVRDRQRVWCPRCHGTLLAPSTTSSVADPQWATRPSASPLQPSSQQTPPRLPQGYRWIAVRPGSAPPARRGRRELGPTPRYTSIPPWGLVEHFDVPDQQAAPPRRGPSIGVVRIVLVATMAAFAVAALAHVVQYALLLINRSVLLHPLLATAANLLSRLASVAAAFLLLAAAVVLTNWLIARRAAAFAHRGQDDPVAPWKLSLGCLLPVVNLVFAPVFVVELATAEERADDLHRPVVVWWIAWAVSYLVSSFAIATAFTDDTQGIANNVVLTTVGYLIGLETLLLLMKVVDRFERRPVERPVTRWVMVPDTQTAARDEDQSPAPVESEGQNPAA